MVCKTYKEFKSKQKWLPESHQEAEEEPDLGRDTAATQTIREPLAAQLVVVDRVHHEHWKRAEHPANVKDVPSNRNCILLPASSLIGSPQKKRKWSDTELDIRPGQQWVKM